MHGASHAPTHGMASVTVEKQALVSGTAMLDSCIAHGRSRDAARPCAASSCILVCDGVHWISSCPHMQSVFVSTTPLRQDHAGKTIVDLTLECGRLADARHVAGMPPSTCSSASSSVSAAQHAQITCGASGWTTCSRITYTHRWQGLLS